MKLTHYIYISTALALFAACSEEEMLTPSYTVGEADNAIVLMAGISQGGNGQTRASYNPEDNHGKHVLFDENTQIRVRVSGEWWKTASSTEGEEVVKTAAVTVGNVANNTHRELLLPLNWDDYGTADPNNKKQSDSDSNRGRENGLTIYGVAVDGETSAPSVENWESLLWSVLADQKSNGWSAQDLLISNNVAEEDAYKFDQRTAGKLLEFKHAMSKITVNVAAGAGYTDGKFVANPEVYLLNFYTKGNVNVKTGVISQTDPATSASELTTHVVESGAEKTKAQFDALVFPGNTFTATIGSDDKKTPTSSTNILKIKADGNIYYVTAAQLVKALNPADATGNVSGSLVSGKNYILNVTIAKTTIIVEATIKNWDPVNLDMAWPAIKVNQTYGIKPTDDNNLQSFNHSYDFYRSETLVTGYDENSTSEGFNPAAVYTYSSEGGGSWNNTLYWPTHDTHFFFRGVSPCNTAVTTVNGKDVIAVSNSEYNATNYPLVDLAIALPRTTGTTCQHTGKKEETNGICATGGTIYMNFEYAMSKVEVRLKCGAESTATDYIDVSNAEIKIIGGYKTGRIKMSDGLHDEWIDTEENSDKIYTLNGKTPTADGFTITTLDAIVPQDLSDGVKFVITVGGSTDNKDVYEAQINKISIKNSDPATPITEWEHGKHYIYELDLRKTKVNVVATIKDWTTVTAEDHIWF